MAEYTNAEKADMILAYGATDCNGRAAQRLYAERHPVRRTPAHTMFARLHQKLCETGSFQKAARNRDRTARTELNEQIVLYMVETTPSLSIRASVLFTDEASFSREGIFNTHNSHSWAAANPHVTHTRAAQDRFLVNQDGAPAHFSISVRNHLDATCGERWIGRGGLVHWPPRSPDLSCLDYFFWGQMKSLVYETPVNSAEELVARIGAAAGKIRNTPEMLSNVRRSMKR
ncbi:transposase-like protein [Trichonephila clavipes]|nr:transposase-like protein [Trichonephila clavipes]